MNDPWTKLVRLARTASRPSEDVPFGFEEAVLRRLALAGRESAADAWIPLLRPALGLAFATAVLCVLLQVRAEPPSPDNYLLAETENLIRLAVLK